MKKQITIKEAANNLSTLTNAVDKNGIISITKYTKEKYVIMTKDEYDRRFNTKEKLLEKLKTPIIGDYIHKATYTEGICKVRSRNKKIEIETIAYNNKEPVSYSKLAIPEKLVSLSETSIWQINYDLNEIIFKGAEVKSADLNYMDNEEEKNEVLEVIRSLEREYETSENKNYIELIF